MNTHEPTGGLDLDFPSEGWDQHQQDINDLYEHGALEDRMRRDADEQAVEDGQLECWDAWLRAIERQVRSESEDYLDWLESMSPDELDERFGGSADAHLYN